MAPLNLPAKARHRLTEHQEYLARHDPGLLLTVDEVAARARMTGAITVPVGGGMTRQFEIELRYKGLNPFRTPTTHDPAGRFPPSPDRHIWSDGQFCMWLPQTAPNDFHLPDGLAHHLDRVREFLILQLMYDDRLRRGITPAWPGPAWAHGDAAHQEWLREQVEAAELDPAQLRAFTPYLRGRRRLNGGQRCPCGSGRRASACHRPWLGQIRDALAQIPPVQTALEELLKEHHATPR
jgi:hypothetical protein